MNDQKHLPASILTLRDHFASVALQGFLANQKFDDDWYRNFAVPSAYRMADRMLEERKK